MSISKENTIPIKFPKSLINRRWNLQYELVYKYFCDMASSIGYKPTVRDFCIFLDISVGKRNKWSQGQWPSAEDLEKLHDRMGFSYKWLITGESDPFDENDKLLKSEEEKDEIKIRQLKIKIRELEEKLEESKNELAEADRLNRKLTNKLFIESASDQDGRTDTGKASGQE